MFSSLKSRRLITAASCEGDGNVEVPNSLIEVVSSWLSNEKPCIMCQIQTEYLWENDGLKLRETERCGKSRSTKRPFQPDTCGKSAE